MAMAMAIHQSNTHLQRDVRNVSQIQFIDGKLKLIGRWYEWGQHWNDEENQRKRFDHNRAASGHGGKP